MELKAPATAPAPRLEEQPLGHLGPLTLIPDVVTGPTAGVFGRVVCFVPRRVIVGNGGGLRPAEGTEGCSDDAVVELLQLPLFLSFASKDSSTVA